jgi:hypothetical protein
MTKFLLPIFLFIYSCSDDRTAIRGGGIEIPNGISLRLEKSDGSPMAGAKVQATTHSYWLDQAGSGDIYPLSEAVSDDSGRVKISLPDDDVLLSVESPEEGLLIKGSYITLDQQTLVSSPLESRTLEVNPEQLLPSNLFIYGSNWKAQPSTQKENLEYTFERIPRQLLHIVASFEQAPPQYAGSVNDSCQTQTLRLDSAFYVFDDFEDGNINHRLHFLYPNGAWWSTARQGSLYNFTFLDISDNRDIVRGVENKYGGIQVNFTPHKNEAKTFTSQTYTVANFGLTTTTSVRQWPDFRDVDSVRFQWKCEGQWRFMIEVEEDENAPTEDLGFGNLSNTLKWYYEMPCTSEFMPYSIALDDMRLWQDPLDTWSPVPENFNPEMRWSDDKRKVRNFYFETNFNGYFFVDDFSFSNTPDFQEFLLSQILYTSFEE